MKIFINNRERHLALEKISFSVVVNYALYSLPHFDRIAPTVTYRYAHGTENYAMREKSSIRLQDGMHFSVINGKRVVSASPFTNAVVEEPRVTVKPAPLETNQKEFTAKGLDWPPSMTKEQQDAEIKRVQELMAPHEARYQAEQAAKRNNLAEGDARLKDAYIVINLLYADLVAAGLWTPGRRMAGTLLYSACYAETVKKLENQTI